MHVSAKTNVLQQIQVNVDIVVSSTCTCIVSYRWLHVGFGVVVKSGLVNCVSIINITVLYFLNIQAIHVHVLYM